MSSSGTIEEGIATFAAESFKDVILQLARKPSTINVNIVELPDTYNTGSVSNTETDIPSRYSGTIQAAAYWISDYQFRITTSAPFYGNIRWMVLS
jgi:hypothetical protein